MQHTVPRAIPMGGKDTSDAQRRGQNPELSKGDASISPQSDLCFSDTKQVRKKGSAPAIQVTWKGATLFGIE